MSQENVEIVQEVVSCIVIRPDGTRRMARDARPTGAAEAGLASRAISPDERLLVSPRQGPSRGLPTRRRS
jgi:hypothetical protein